jgi:hypothetical protein
MSNELFGCFADDKVGGYHFSLSDTAIAINAFEEAYDSMFAYLYTMLLYCGEHRKRVTAERRIGKSADS